MSDTPRRPKTELPLSSDAEIAELVGQFEACTLPYEHWTHRAHLAVALHYLRAMPATTALDRLRHHIQLFNRTVGDPGGNHETITRMFVRKVAAHLAANPDTHLPTATNELARDCDSIWLLTHYTKDRLWSPQARSEWLEPDLKGLDFCGRKNNQRTALLAATRRLPKRSAALTSPTGNDHFPVGSVAAALLFESLRVAANFLDSARTPL